jgi:hypothetical protein
LAWQRPVLTESVRFPQGFAATDVKGVSIANSGHWLREEPPAATMATIVAFIGA